MLALLLAVSVLASEAPPPIIPVVIRTDKDAYTGKDTITVTLESRADAAVWIEPLLRIERSEGDGRWTPVYALRATDKCPPQPPKALQCVKVAAGERVTLEAWDWYTGGETQCPPRRPGHRAFKGVHRIIAKPCASRGPKGSEPRVKLVTFE